MYKYYDTAIITPSKNCVINKTENLNLRDKWRKSYAK
mgnify:CR=1 FL=1|jgi:hypothetical protein